MRPARGKPQDVYPPAHAQSGCRMAQREGATCHISWVGGVLLLALACLWAEAWPLAQALPLALLSGLGWA